MKLTAMSRAIPYGSKAQKLLRIFKLTALILLTVCSQINAKDLSNNINYTGENIPLEKVFQKIRQQTGYVFFYRNDDPALSEKILHRPQARHSRHPSLVCSEAPP